MKRFFSLMVVCLLAFMGVANAQTLTVYDGTTTSSYIPAYGGYFDEYAKSEFVIPAGELAAMNGSDITSIKFYIDHLSTGGTGWGGAHQQVFLKEVPSTTLSAFSGLTNATVVFDGALPGPAAGEMEISFSTPYHYNGGNLLIGLYNTQKGGYKFAYFLGKALTSGVSGRGHNPGSLEAVPFNADNFLPKTTFTYGEAGSSPITVTPDPVRPFASAVYRPNGHWMRPFTVNVANQGSSVVINSIDAQDDTDGYFVIEEMEFPFNLGSNEDIDVNITTGDFGSNDIVVSNFVVSYDAQRVAKITPMMVYAYNAVSPDVFELPRAASTFPYTDTPDFDELYDNYVLPGDNEDTIRPDAVYKLVITKDMLLNGSVANGMSPLMAIYGEDFGGQPGPSADNTFRAFADRAEVVFSESFDSSTLPVGWTFVDADGDGHNWESTIGVYNTAPHTGEGALFSRSWGTNRPNYDPDNWAITPQITVPANGQLKYWISSQKPWTNEHYGVFISTTGTAPADFTKLFDETLPLIRGNSGAFEGKGEDRGAPAPYQEKTINLASYAGQDVYIAFRHYESTGIFRLYLDDVSVSGTPGGTIVANDFLQDIVLVPGTYYVVAAAASEFTVNLNAEDLPCPALATNIYPADNTDSLAPASVTLKWKLDPYATEYCLLFGSTYYCEDTLVNWTRDLAESYTVTDLYNNTNYFWRVCQRNNGCPDGVNGTVWGFTTHLNYPTYLHATNANGSQIYEGEDLNIAWTAIQDRTFRQYNIYQNGELIGHTPANTAETTYTVESLEYDMDGYEFNVTAVYDEGESAFSNTLIVQVSGKGSVDGYVYEQDSTTGIANTTVTKSGQDEFGRDRIYTFTTDNSGHYSGEMLAGTYEGVASCEGYQNVEYAENPFAIVYGNQTSGIDYIMDEVFAPVANVVAEYYPDPQNPGSPYVKVYWGSSSGTGDEFSVDFEDGMPVDWTVIDADGDGNVWEMRPENWPGGGFLGHGGSNGFAISRSWMGYPLTPDNYFVSPQVTIGVGSTLSFWACGQDASYPAEHFGVAVSTTGNTAAADFTTIQEWTMTAKGNGAKGPRGTNAQGQWYQYSVDLNAYAGQQVYLAIRHFGCSDQFVLDIDDIQLTNSRSANRSFSHYRVYRTDCYNTEYTPENTILLTSDNQLQDTIYIDVSWSDAAPGVYKWGVSRVYEGNRESRISWGEPAGVSNSHVANIARGTFAAKNNTTAGEYNGNGLTNRDGWMYYDDGVNVDAIGLTSGGSFYWGIVFPNMNAYDGNLLTKVSMYDHAAHSGRIMIYQGGTDTPGTLVYSQDYTTTGTEANVEFTLDNPVQINGSQSLWVVMKNTSGQYVASFGAYCGDPKSAMISLDGTEWFDVITATSGAIEGSWNLRAYVEDNGGNSGQNTIQGPRESEIVWSNCLDKDMTISNVEVTVLLNSNDCPFGTTVALENLNEEDYSYEVALDSTGHYVWNEIRRGSYAVEVAHEGYNTILDTVTIDEPTSLRYVLIEQLNSVGNLYVSRTGWAMWEGQSAPIIPGTEFTFGFEEELAPSGWTIQSHDATTWERSQTTGFGAAPHEGEWQMWLHWSWGDQDEWLITPEFVVPAQGNLNFWMFGFLGSTNGDHYYVKISADGGGTWTALWDASAQPGGENHYNSAIDVDLSAYAGQSVKLAWQGLATGGLWYAWCIDDITVSGGREVLSFDGRKWYRKAIVVTEPSGPDQFSKDGSRGMVENRHLEFYKVLCTSIDGEPIFNVNTERNFCQVATESLVPGDTYICKVAAVYSTGMSAWEEVKWQYQACADYEGVANDAVTAEQNGENIVLNWAYPGSPVPPTPPTPPTGNDHFEEGFENGIPADWTLIDADGDGKKFELGSVAYAGYTVGPHTGEDMIVSASWEGSALTPDNYIVSPNVAFKNGSSFTFWANAQDAGYPAEHFGVAISTSGNTNASDFTTIQEWTMTAKSNGSKGPRGTNDQGQWYQYTVDLSSYAGQNGYIAIRHFNCSDNFYLNVDDLKLTAGTKGNRDVLLEEHFATGLPAGWMVLDADNDGHNWEWTEDYKSLGSRQAAAFRGECMMSESAHDMGGGNYVPYTPDNYLITPMVDGAAKVTYKVGSTANASYCAEHYAVCASSTGTAAADFSVVMEENVVYSNGTASIEKTVELPAGTKYVAIRHFNCTDLLAMLIDDVVIEGGANPNPNPNPNPSADVLGAVIFRDGEYLAFTEEATYTDMAPEAGQHEYCVRVVYNGANALPDSNFYYAMSCPDCVVSGSTPTCEPGAPITGVYKWNAPDNFGSLISWGENIQPIAEWLYYDNGENADAIGLTNGGSFYWGIMFPKDGLAAYGGCSLTKVSFFDYEAHTGNILIYQGGDTKPGTLVLTQPYTATGSKAYVEVQLSNVVGIDITQNIWIVMNNSNGQYVAAIGEDTGNANGRWISMDGNDWADINAATGGQITGTWNLRGFVTNAAKGKEAVVIEVPSLNGTPGGVITHTGVSLQGDAPAYNPVRAEITKYNVYRSTENANYSLIGSVNAVAGQTYYEYYDAVNAINTYYYQVKAEYDNGCESEPAQSAVNPANNYVTVNVTSIGQFDDEVNLYPNPTSGNVTIQATGMNRITVVSALGQVVYDAEIENDMTTLNMGQFTAGIYTVRIATATGVSVKRVTVVK